MESVFLSYSFTKPEDRLIVSDVEDLFRSFGVRIITGLNLGGNELTPEIRELIDRSDALVSLATQREQLVSGEWVTHPWILEEFGYAKSIGINAIAILENDVTMGGGLERSEYIPFDRANSAEAMLKLAKTLGVWKEKAGNRLKVRLLPDDLLDDLNLPSIQYQFNSLGSPLGWHDVKPVLEPGGVYVHVNGARDDYLIEVKVFDRDHTKCSRATSQSMPVIVES